MPVVARALTAAPQHDAVLLSEGPLLDPPYDLSAAASQRLERAVPKRVREFASGRHRAREVCARLGAQVADLEHDQAGAAVWPAGLTGSITHCDTWAAAAAASQDAVAALGIDAELALPLPEGLVSLVATPGEQMMLAGLAATSPSTPWDRLLFSAKEAVYKAWYPLIGSWLDFLDVAVKVRPDGTLSARACRDGHARAFRGGWAVYHDLLATAVVVPAGQTDRR